MGAECQHVSDVGADWHGGCEERRQHTSHMNTLLKITAFILATALPLVATAEFLGYAIPNAINTVHVFTALCSVLAGLMLLADYGRNERLAAARRQVAALPRASLRLAA
jgi:hypothetical protein